MITLGSDKFLYLSEESCPACGLPPGEEGHGALMASMMTEEGRQVYLLCRECAERVRAGEMLNEARILSSLKERDGAIPLPESIRG